MSNNRGWTTCKDHRDHFFLGKWGKSLCDTMKYPIFRKYKTKEMGKDDRERPNNVCQNCVDIFVFTT